MAKIPNLLKAIPSHKVIDNTVLYHSFAAGKSAFQLKKQIQRSRIVINVLQINTEKKFPLNDA